MSRVSWVDDFVSFFRALPSNLGNTLSRSKSIVDDVSFKNGPGLDSADPNTVKSAVNKVPLDSNTFKNVQGINANSEQINDMVKAANNNEYKGFDPALVRQTKDEAASGVVSWMKKNPGKTVTASVAAAVGAYATVKFFDNNKKKATIIKIEADKDGGFLGIGAKQVAKITYSPDIEMIETDNIDISGTNSTPVIDGSGIPVYKIYASNCVGIEVSEKISNNGNTGTLILHTDILNRVFAALGDGAGSMINSGSDAVSQLGDSIFGSTTLQSLFIFFFFILFLYIIYKLFLSKKGK